MKSLVFSQYAIVRANTAALFTQKLNEEIYKLKDKTGNDRRSRSAGRDQIRLRTMSTFQADIESGRNDRRTL